MKKYQPDLVLAISTALTSNFCRTRRNRLDYCVLLSSAIAGLLLTAAASRAVEVTWTGGINSNWSNDGNWDVHIPLSGDSIFFPNTGQTNVRADFSSYLDTDPHAFDQPPLHLQSLTFDAAAPAYSVDLYTSGASSPMYQARLDLDGAGVVNQSGVTQNFVIDRGGSHGVAGGNDVGVDGSRMSFNNSASAGSNVTYHALGGVTTFHTTPAGVYVFLRPSGGSVVFHNSASAGSGTFVTDGGAGNGGIPAFVEFYNNSTAANGEFTNNDGAAGGNAPGYNPSPICGFGGQTNFYDTASAGAATLSNIGQSLPYSGGTAGITNFRDSSSAASASIHNRGATADAYGAGFGGATQFFGHATAGSAAITNEPSPIFAGGGTIYFGDDSTAAHALIDNVGGSNSTAPGATAFYGRSTAANAIINNRGLTGGGPGGQATSTTFHDLSTAGAATIHNFSGPDTGGITEFSDHSTAGSAHIILEPSHTGGMIVFKNESSAGSAYLDASANNTTGQILFRNQSTAANAVISLGANSGYSLNAEFRETASAGNATITARSTSNVQFFNGSSAGGSNITVHGEGTVTFNGNFQGGPINSAGSATIRILGGSSNLAPGGAVYFSGLSSAGSASLTVEGAGVNGASPGNLLFNGSANAGSATIRLKSSPVADNPGGIVTFNGTSGALARVITEVGTTVNVVGAAGTNIGYIDGSGDINLNHSTLTVGALGQNTTISGTISDVGVGVGGRLTKAGVDALTLSSSNTYTGLTTVEQGTLILTGSISGNADVKSGATFKGTGLVGGTLNCEGICAPGTSPGTLTVGGLNLVAGSTLQFELGAVRDHIVVTNNGNITLGGVLDISLLDGFVPVGPTVLFEGAIGSITGTFSSVYAPIFNGHTLGLVYSGNQVSIQVVDAGDFNHDGEVGTADYVLWRKNPGRFPADAYATWVSHFGQNAGSGSLSDAPVPEPTTLVLLMFASAGQCLRRSRST